VGNKKMLPRLIELLPNNSDKPLDIYPHGGEEFVYVLEGILTLAIDYEQHDLFPGDSAHYDSGVPHNWGNYTNKQLNSLWLIHLHILIKKGNKNFISYCLFFRPF
jgi:glyoxylate utilization-related uncharacterized protein